MSVRHHDVVVVGSGLGGLTCALSATGQSVALLTKTASLASGSSLWAQGGIAAAVGPGDSAEAHAADTVAAGAGLSDPVQTRQLTEDGAASLQWLVDTGVVFDRAADGTFALAREGAHRCARVVHAGGDATGNVIVRTLVDRIAENKSINVFENTFAYDLVMRRGRVAGLISFSTKTGWVFHHCRQVVLATGGIGMAWRLTTNPVEATGDGLAIAARAGARLENLEFVQFHPTALDVPSQHSGSRLPLLTEALRGAGAKLIDESGHRFMLQQHIAAELAPRDVVARAIQERSQRGLRSFLDLREILNGPRKESFPNAVEYAQRAGFDPYSEPLPVTPAAHYHMGGVHVDANGRTSIPGLWACGEVATTGVHGANRLASNSLLEAVVIARRAAADIAKASERRSKDHGDVPKVPGLRCDRQRLADLRATARQSMSDHVGISRTGVGLRSALQELTTLERSLEASIDADAGLSPPANIEAIGETRNILLVSKLIAFAALGREESRGAHYRGDFPEASASWRHSQLITADNLSEAH